MIESQKKLIEDLGKPKVNVVLPSDWVNIIETLNSFAKPRIVEALSIQDKLQRKAALSQIFEEFVSQYENINSQKVLLGYQYKKLISKVMREKLFKEGKRIDGRTPDEIRPIDIKIHPFERPHGSAVFTRGQTQVFASVTLGSREEAQLVESIYEGEVFKRFMLHYNFPPFCTGEARPWGPREEGK